MRSIWYGSRAIVYATPSTPASATLTNSRNGVPATSRMPHTISEIAIVVPRSGSSGSARSTTTTTAPTGLNSCVSVRGGRLREASTAAANTSTAPFAISDGWIEIGPM